MDLNQRDITKNSIEIFAKMADNIIPVPNPSLVMPTPLSHEESNQDIIIRRSSQDSLPSSFRDQNGSVLSIQNNEKRGSFKKHLITSAAQRLRDVNSSFSSVDNKFLEEPKNTQSERNKNNSTSKNDAAVPHVNSLASGTNKTSQGSIRSENIVPQKCSGSQDFQALDLEEATKEALKSLTSKLEIPGEAYGSKDTLDGLQSSRLPEKEVYINEFKITEEDSQETGPVDDKVLTPAPDVYSKSKKNGRDKSHSAEKGISKDFKSKEGNVVSFSLSSLDTRGNTKNNDSENNKNTNLYNLVKSCEFPSGRFEKNSASKQKFENSDVYENSNIKSSAGSAEKIASEDLSKLNRSYHESSQNMSFTVENPLSEKYDAAKSITSKCGLTDRLFTDTHSINRGDSSKREKISDYILEIAESSRMSETNGYRTYDPDNDEEDAVSLESERLTSKRCQGQLIESSKKITARTFLGLKNIIKPNDNILVCCQALVKIFAGLHEAIPSSFSIMSNIEWNNIKVLFNSPAKIVNLITSLPKLIETGKVPQRNITAALVSLTKIPHQPGEIQNEAFYHIYEFIVSAIEYYKYFRPELLGDLQDSARASQEELDSMRSTQSFGQENLLVRKVNENYQARSPSKQENNNALHKTLSTTNSTTRRGIPSTASPMKENRTSRLSSSRSPQRENNKKPFLSEAKARALEFSARVRSAHKSKSPGKKTSEKKHADGVLQDYHFTLGTEEDLEGEQVKRRIGTLEVESEAINLQDEIEIKEKQARDFRAKANRLLADHERYVKRLLKAQEDDKVVFERKDELEERKRLEEYLVFRDIAEEEYMRELGMEDMAARKEIKYRQARHQKEQLNDVFMENVKEHCFLVTQNERKKNERKKQLWEQFKKKMAEKQAKRQKEAEESTAQKQEITTKRIESYAWKKKQATQERDTWKENYMLLAKLVGDAK